MIAFVWLYSVQANSKFYICYEPVILSKIVFVICEGNSPPTNPKFYLAASKQMIKKKFECFQC